MPKGKTATKQAPASGEIDPRELEGWETKALPVYGVKVLDAAQGIVEAFVAGIGNVDEGNDVIEPGFFTESLAEVWPKGVRDHDWSQKVAKTLEAYEIPAGDARLPTKLQELGAGALYVKGQYNMEKEAGRDAFADAQFYGDEQEWSIGYVALEAPRDAKGVRHLKRGRTYEWSDVLFGMNRATGTLALKQAAVRGEAKVSEAAWDGAASRFDDAQWKKAAAACRGESDAPKSDCFLPHHEPSGAVSRAGVHAAAARFNQVTAPAAAKSKAKSHLAAHYKNDLSEDVPTALGGKKTLQPATLERAPSREVEGKAWVTLDGSYEDQQDDLREAIADWGRAAYPTQYGRDVYCYLEATYPDHAVIRIYSWSGDEAFFEVAYTANADDTITWGTATEVEIQATTVAVAADQQSVTAEFMGMADRRAVETHVRIGGTVYRVDGMHPDTKALLLTKVGRRHSTTDQTYLQKAHDMLVALGADCGNQTKDDTAGKRLEPNEDGLVPLTELEVLELEAIGAET